MRYTKPARVYPAAQLHQYSLAPATLGEVKTRYRLHQVSLGKPALFFSAETLAFYGDTKKRAHLHPAGLWVYSAWQKKLGHWTAALFAPDGQHLGNATGATREEAQLALFTPEAAARLAAEADALRVPYRGWVAIKTLRAEGVTL